MTIPERHHFVPKAILRRFCYEGERLWYHVRGQKGEVEPRNIETIFSRRHLNTVVMSSGARDVSLELFFSENFDNFIPRISRKLEDVSRLRLQPPFLSDDDHGFFVQFLYNHIRRSPDFHEGHFSEDVVEKIVTQTIVDYETQIGPLRAKERRHLESAGFAKHIESRLKVGVVGAQNTKVLDFLLSYRPVVATPKNPKKQFLVASNPVVINVLRRAEHPEDNLMEYWTTLTPRLAVGLAPFAFDFHMEMSNQLVGKLNLALARQSRAIGGQSKELVCAFAKRLKNDE